ncbi:methyltransferase family protein [Oryzobacter telluris]|uniref:methyltransferase family protein n=1 Tax=Oryzobacter telluris TaxID=3149179 RepID=UPI00370DDCC0
MDAPSFRIWPPVALGVPLTVGLVLSASLGDPVAVGGAVTSRFGWALAAAFVLWNGWTLAVMARNRTAILPGEATALVLQAGPFRLSRNPLYLGLVALDVAIALLAHSFWALLLVPVGVAALLWGAILPEERYLTEKFGAEYTDYAARVRRWL